MEEESSAAEFSQALPKPGPHLPGTGGLYLCVVACGRQWGGSLQRNHVTSDQYIQYVVGPKKATPNSWRQASGLIIP